MRALNVTVDADAADVTPTSHPVVAGYALDADAMGTLAENVSPPSSDAAARRRQARVSGLSRRSAQVTKTTPSLLTPTAGSRWSGPFPPSAGDRSSFTTIGFDQVFPLSAECERLIWMRSSTTAGHTTYTRSLNTGLPKSAASCPIMPPSERRRSAKYEATVTDFVNVSPPS